MKVMWVLVALSIHPIFDQPALDSLGVFERRLECERAASGWSEIDRDSVLNETLTLRCLPVVPVAEY